MKRILLDYTRSVTLQELEKNREQLRIEALPVGAYPFLIASIFLTGFPVTGDSAEPANPKSKKKTGKKKQNDTTPESTGIPLIVVAPSNQEAEALSHEVSFYFDERRVVYFPGYEGIPYEFAGLSTDIIHQRVRSLHRILSGESLIVITSPEGLLRKMPSPERLRNLMFLVKEGSEMEMDVLLHQLAEYGYSRTDRVELPGEFCHKGSIVDIFPVNSDSPYRLDFFGDELESIRMFDPDSQVGGNRVSEVSLLPGGEVLLTSEESARLVEILSGDRYNKFLERPVWFDHLSQQLKSGERPVLNQADHSGIEELYPLVIQTSSLVEFFHEKPRIAILHETRLESRLEQIYREFSVLHEKEKVVRTTIPPEEILQYTDSFYDLIVSYGCYPIVFDGAITSRVERKESEDTEEKSTAISDDEQSQNPFERWKVRSAPVFHGRIRNVREHIMELIADGGRVIITSSYHAQLNRVAGIFQTEKDITVNTIDEEGRLLSPEFNHDGKGAGEVWVCRGSVREGFFLPENRLYVWSDADIFGRSYKRRSRFKSSSSSPIESFLDLKENDYVVHVNYGVGRFIGLERVNAAGRDRDFLILEYADQDRLFVPLDQISLVQKYSSHVESPKLDNLGKASFKKVKERVEKRVEEFAQELIKIYAVRMSRKGYGFPDDIAWQEEFEGEFPYDETPDQLAAIEAVKRDMETDRPMDRLICGDVGYGKTEVAIRAAFKAVMSGKQAILIAPTTILAMQHYRSFSSRFSEYPIRVDWMSRFRTRGEITSLKKAMRAGEVDVVIGTHALLSKEILMKNLGLLIIDEEQRFGVAHKESIKNVKKLVDVLTLSATPIPRTLHMSMVGIRDISIIQTPPRNRLPVRTYVMEDSDSVMMEAIQREIDRGGQVFILHNRVETIQILADRVHGLMPHLSIAILHGKLHEDEIEDILMDFMEKKYDILVTTTIIESGIDMPNVNTLIIDRAEMFGLSQIYQIRGRVGRSDRQAYAYLFYPRGRVLTETAQKRLNTILEYQDLGSGFKVAMRDLEIRGAGNVLGKEQSGDIVDVGYELYVKLLDEAVRKLKGDEVEVEVRTSINLKTDFYLPDDYIHDIRQRIEFYKRFESARRQDEVLRLYGEMEDRFGKAPETAVTFGLVEQIRTLASIAGFENVYEDDSGRICFRAGEHFRVPPDHIIHMLQSNIGLSVVPGEQNTLFYSGQGEGNDRLYGVVGVLERLVVPVLEKLEELEEAKSRQNTPGVTVI